jgi:hypothetical protein
MDFKSLLAVVLLPMCAGTVAAQESSDPAVPARARLLVLNLAPVAVDLQLGDVPVFSLKALAPGSLTTFVEVPADSPKPLYFKSAQAADWRIFDGGDGAAGPAFAAGTSTVVRIGRQSGVELISLSDFSADLADRGALALVFFLNASEGDLEIFSLVDGYGHAVAETADIPDQAFTGLVGVPPGSYAGIAGSPVLPVPSADGAVDVGSVMALTGLEAGQRYAIVAAGGLAAGIWHLGGGH